LFPISRRQFTRALAPLTFGSFLLPRFAGAQPKTGAARFVIPLDGDWLFGGKLAAGATDRAFDDGNFSKVTLPHVVTKLSWRDWDPTAWEDV